MNLTTDEIWILVCGSIAAGLITFAMLNTPKPSDEERQEVREYNEANEN